MCLRNDDGRWPADDRRRTIDHAPSSIVYGLSSMVPSIVHRLWSIVHGPLHCPSSMADLAIRVDNLSKQYRIGSNRQRHERVAETMMSGRFDRWRPT